MATLVHTPYDGRARPFSIGLQPIAPNHWIAPDELLLPELAIKQDLLSHRRNVVVRERADTRAAQTELLEVLCAHLLHRHGGIFSMVGNAMTIGPAGRAVNLADASEPPIVTAARLIQDDLVLMRRDQDRWYLAAACLCFPSSWSLAEKFNQPMDAIHANVPGYAGQMARRIDRIFDCLQVGKIVERFNWSLQNDNELHHPKPKSGPGVWQDGDRDLASQSFIRVERQTLRKLPRSGDIIFTIRIYLDPVQSLRGHPDGAALAGALHRQLAALDSDQLAYKNLLADRDTILKGLAALAS